MNAWAVIVAYHPSGPALSLLAEKLLMDSVYVLVVDNTPDVKGPPYLLPAGCERLQLGRNTGIAAAQNLGIAFARQHGAEAIVFFDQDSVIVEGYVPALLRHLRPTVPGVVGPACFDLERGFEYPSFRLDDWGWAHKVFSRPGSGLQPVDMMISSGSATTVDTFDVAGTMDEDFFIDYVDLEWCIRCRRHGVPIHVAPDCTMTHSIGQCSVDVGPLKAFLHSPARSYYRVRNAFLLLRRRHVPRLFAIKEIAAALVHHLLVLPQSTSRAEHMRVYLSGISDGIRGISGPKI
ncbi:glycosyltransferase family 2 protein [Rhizobacter sp. AJA081-3]|uniref:glycosyltransferase family 2 protein n=1 Tax=Rhizobacter sp. AJA081-3 TaxID=2753607 RepID=UPI001ADFE602|nr:glycosyltransferase family 2 protein [Rhizobacter sp. AJA081-3]QTN24256.1 glycosyltransferase family 2 protein [Rhizobacter sp. AJA081-3]